ncbi:MAG TPA: response regulator [Methanobacterium sp.]|nr:response regulator [Methanobacterium sp.]
MVKRLNILLVENNHADACLIREYLKECRTDVKIDHVTRLVDAIKNLLTDHYDILFLDLTTPESHGIDTYELIKRYFHNPIILLSGYPPDALKFEFDNRSFFLNKNKISPGLIKKTLQKCIQT